MGDRSTNTCDLCHHDGPVLRVSDASKIGEGAMTKKFYVVLKHIHDEKQRIVLSECASLVNARMLQKNWRSLLGGKNWITERRPGLDTLDNLGLTVETSHD